MDRQILIGEYDVDDSRRYDTTDFYRGDHEDIVRVRTSVGTMWVQLVNQPGATNVKFDPMTERVLVFLLDPDYIISSSSSEGVVDADKAFGMVIKVPPQYRRSAITRDREVDEGEAGGGTGAEMPTKIMGGSDSGFQEGYVYGTDTSKIVASDDMLLLKGPGGRIAICQDTILIDGNVVNMGFFNESRGGVLKENWLANIIPTTAITPFPMYNFDDTLLRRIAGLAETIGEFIG